MKNLLASLLFIGVFNYSAIALACDQCPPPPLPNPHPDALVCKSHWGTYTADSLTVQVANGVILLNGTPLQKAPSSVPFKWIDKEGYWISITPEWVTVYQDCTGYAPIEKAAFFCGE
jgi:hypothetical protein